MSNKLRNILISVGMLVSIFLVAILFMLFNRSSKTAIPSQEQTKIVQKKQHKKITKQTVAALKPKYSKPKPGIDEVNLYRTNILPVGTGSAATLSDAKKKQALDYMAQEQFKTYEKWMGNLINKNLFNHGVNLDLAGIYADEQTFEDCLHNANGLTLQQLGTKFAKNVKTPETFAILGLYFDQIARSRFILDPDSISPIGFNGLTYVSTKKFNSTNINSAPTYQGKNIAKLAWYAANQGAVYQVTIKVQDLQNWITYNAYVGEDPKGKLMLYGYYPQDKDLSKITDKKLSFYFTKEMKKKYQEAEANEIQRIQEGKVDPNKLYPWIEKGGSVN